MPKAVPVRSRRATGPMSFKRKNKDSESETEGIVPEDITKRIIKLARDQIRDADRGEDEEYSDASDDFGNDEEGDYVEADEEVDEEDENMQADFARKQGGARELETEGRMARGGIDMSEIETDLPAEAIAHYTRIGKFLSVYTVGKIPKGFKLLPTRKQWEELLYFTNPVEWTPHAHFQATKIFASNLNDNLAQRYYNLVLLPAIHADIKENKKLHFQLYQSLKKALFKPLAFMKGILLPFADSPDSTLREAMIIGSVVGKMTVPMAYGAAALLKLAVKADKWTPVRSILVTLLLNKKYSLPTQVVEGLVAHFESFARMHEKMPVLWHASLLTFVQRYKSSISETQKNRLLALTKSQNHYQMTPEIRRELLTQATTDSLMQM